MSSGDPKGPLGIVGQLQLDLDGVEPLTDEERVETWLREQEQSTPETRTAALCLRDQQTRRARAARWGQVKAVQDRFPSEWGWLVPGGAESLWLYHEAERSFVEGFPLAALLCGHAACERVLAGCLQFYEEELREGWRRWGLGPLVEEASKRRLIDQPLSDGLLRVNEVRKVSAHFKPPLEPNSLHSRAAQSMEDSFELDGEEVLDQIAEADALLAIETATELMRGDQGFRRSHRPLGVDPSDR